MSYQITPWERGSSSEAGKIGLALVGKKTTGQLELDQNWIRIGHWKIETPNAANYAKIRYNAKKMENPIFWCNSRQFQPIAPLK